MSLKTAILKRYYSLDLPKLEVRTLTYCGYFESELPAQVLFSSLDGVPNFRGPLPIILASKCDVDKQYLSLPYYDAICHIRCLCHKSLRLSLPFDAKFRLKQNIFFF
ncbi:hypothetical protein TNCV_4350781 [Trichonephila clavipes]|nr:hypothetical protein TNCV_4350781 [Trichonephila clavipes]